MVLPRRKRKGLTLTSKWAELTAAVDLLTLAVTPAYRQTPQSPRLQRSREKKRRSRAPNTLQSDLHSLRV